MPWHLQSDHPDCSGWAVVQDSNGKVVGCHDTKKKAIAQLAALNANVKENAMQTEAKRTGRPPRDNLVRAVPAASGDSTLRGDEGAPPTLAGHFAVFDQWTEIDSMWEGHFLERIAPGAFEKTMKEKRDRIRVTFNHGQDPTMGDQILGKASVLEEDSIGARFEVPLYDGLPPLLMAGLRDGAYGSSFRFRVTREEFEDDAEASKYNPKGLPERTVKEVELFELGPVTFPAYAEATAGVRSLTDEFMFSRLTEDPKRLVQVIDYARDTSTMISDSTTTTTPITTTVTNVAPSVPAPASATPDPERRESEPKEEQMEQTSEIDRYRSVPDLLHRKTELEERNTALVNEYAGQPFPPEQQTEFDRNDTEHTAIEERVKYLEEREARVKRYAGEKPPSGGTRVEPETTFQAPRQTDPFDMLAVRRDSRTPEEEHRKLRDNAKGVVERAEFPHPEVKRDDVQEHIFKLLGTRDDRGNLSRWILATGSELYDRAFGKYLMNQMRTPEEDRALQQAQDLERALSLTGASGGFAIPFQLDPTILGTSNGAVNPWRQIARTETITVDEWRGVSSAGVTVAYAAEAAETTDNAPTLVQPTVSTEKAQAFIPFSIEVGMDWDGLRSEMSRLLADGKDELEAVKFATGTGTNEPFGVITGSTNTVNATAAGVFTLANLYALQAALPPRYRPRAAFAGNLAILQKVRQFETTGGSTSAVWVDGLQAENASRLLGKPVYEASAMASVTTVGALFLLYGDFSRFLIVDRIGLTVELIDHLVGTNHRPTGQRGLYAYFRNGSKVLDANAFRVLIGLA